MEWARRDELGRTRRLKPVQNFCVTTFGGYKFQSMWDEIPFHSNRGRTLGVLGPGPGVDPLVDETSRLRVGMKKSLTELSFWNFL